LTTVADNYDEANHHCGQVGHAQERYPAYDAVLD